MTILVLFFRGEDSIGGMLLRDTEGAEVSDSLSSFPPRSEDNRAGRGCTGLVGRSGLIEYALF